MNTIPILFVAFEFPPLSSGGVQRSLKFVKYLPEFGIRPIVVTTDESSFRMVMDSPIDQELTTEIPPDTAIERVPCILSSEQKHNNRAMAWLRMFFSLVEPQANWWRPQLQATLPDLVHRYNPQAIYVSLPPMGMGPLWCDIARKYKLPLVLDLRDAWSQWQIAPYMTWIHYWLTVRVERSCLNSAAHVICTSEQTRQDFLNLHSHISEDKITTITNGYDVEIRDWSFSKRTKIDSSDDRIIIGYVGSFYYNPAAREAMFLPWWRKKPHQMMQYSSRKEDWLYRSPYFFFRTMKLLLQEKPELRKKILIRFAGKKPFWIDEQIAEFGLRDYVEFAGYLSHEEVLVFQEKCDCLLLTSSKVIGGRDYSIAGKTFEYISQRKPIIAFVTEGAQKDLLEQTGLAIICDPDDEKASIEKIYAFIRNKILLQPDEIFLKGLHRRQLTNQLAKIINQVIEIPINTSIQLQSDKDKDTN